MHLLQAERMVIDTEQGQGDERRRRDRRNPIDALEDLEDDFVDGPPERLVGPARTGLAQREGSPKRTRLCRAFGFAPGHSRRASARLPSPWSTPASSAASFPTSCNWS